MAANDHNGPNPFVSNDPAMFRPPVNRAMRALDRSFFNRTVLLSAAAIYKASDIATVRRELLKSKDILSLPRLSSIREIREPDYSVKKGLLLREDVKHDGELHGCPWILHDG